jgi:hypothetical protein
MLAEAVAEADTAANFMVALVAQGVAAQEVLQLLIQALLQLLTRAVEVVVVLAQIRLVLKLVDQAVRALSFFATPAQLNSLLVAQSLLEAITLFTRLHLLEHWPQQRQHF